MAILREQGLPRMRVNARGWLRPRPCATGVDIGTRQMKIVTLQACGRGLSLTEFSMQPVVEKFNQSESECRQLVEAIRSKISSSSNRIGTSLSGSSVFIKSLILPVMTGEDLRAHLKLELDRYITFDIHEMFWDICRKKSSLEASNEQEEHFLVIARREYVEQQVNVFRQCGVSIQFIDVDIFALTNLVTHNYGNQGTWLLAHIGPTGMVLVVIDGGEPAHIQKVGYEAEWYEDLLDMVSIPKTSLKSQKKLGASESILLEQFFQEAHDQILDTMESFSAHPPAVFDRGILLSGGYAVVPDMAGTLAHTLGMPVSLLNPFESVMVPEAIQQDIVFQQTAPLMGVAMGVALRGALSHD